MISRATTHASAGFIDSITKFIDCIAEEKPMIFFG
jgi:hypothetical protein